MNILLAIPAIIWLLLSGVLNASGEYLSKLWGKNPSWKLAVLVALVYALSSIVWLPALLHKNQLSTMGIAWLLIAVVLTLFLGIVVFSEHLTGMQWVGVVLAIVALFLLIV